MTRIVVIDDWQLVAENGTNWTPLREVAEVAFYQKSSATRTTPSET
jgi:Ser-tRNA(Ala) deacylase AlaX